MKDFYSFHEGMYIPNQSREEYLKGKREVVLKAIQPICEVFDIKDYDYDITDNREILVIEGTRIACHSNSIGATCNQLINYIWLNSYYENHYVQGETPEELYKNLTQYWLED